MRIDLHTHSRVSDGTDTPTTLVMKAFQAGLDAIALTDHDTFGGVLEAQEAGKRIGLKVLCGIEMSTEVEGRAVHLLGYGCDIYDRDLGEELARIRHGRSHRLPMMIEKLNAAGLELTIDDVNRVAMGAPAIGRPHVADAMVAKGYIADRDEAFKVWLDEDRPGYVKRYAASLERAIELIHGAKGVAVIAHPWARRGREVIDAPYLEQLVRDYGLEGIEVDHPDHDDDARSLLFEMGGRLGLLRTGSSDYHGLGKKNNPLGANLTRKSGFRDLLARIRRRGGQIV
ncbi:PHP domain-containing protein [Tessaracoccus sp. MC1756]|uniref:PHP domain-containing protein n=1 Tax=Tessaracoccus sp. MC1756 TaxID=2760311 RepID=UPI001604084E|nr:PHP domain-containing protein [Tessaracoccus sp. MC1756]MBB1509156.1 PHP domain-containing protein [Tessaracoccus sp. MC1756]